MKKKTERTENWWKNINKNEINYQKKQQKNLI